MFEIENVKRGQDKDILVFEVFIPSMKLRLRNYKLRLNKAGKYWIYSPCLCEELPGEKPKFYPLAEFGGDMGESLKNEIIPRLIKEFPEILKA
jgi:hypothetical protein